MMLHWQTELSRQVLQKNAMKGLGLAIVLHLLALLSLRLEFTGSNESSSHLLSSRRTVEVQLKPYAEIIPLQTGGGQGGGEGGGSRSAPIPTEIPGTPVPVADALAPAETLAVTPPVSPTLDSTGAEGTGLPGSSWGSGGTGWGTGPGRGVGLSRVVLSPPRAIMESFPEFPPAARKARAQGVVELNIKVDARGKVVDVVVLRNSTENEACAQAAVAAAFRSRYRPAQTSAGPDTAWVTHKYQFSLRQ
jgi:TonB family protein